MKENPYAPPTAAVADVQQGLPDNSNPLFAVGTVKIFFMSLCTLGIYQLYWMYRHWRLIQARDRSDIMPFWRAFFGVIFCWPLFKRIKEDGETHGVTEGFAFEVLAVLYIALNITWQLPDPWWLIGLATTVVVTLVQHHANRVNAAAAPDHERNDRLTGWNWVAVVLGGMLLLLALVGLFVPESVVIEE
jgi:hypothetical protein